MKVYTAAVLVWLSCMCFCNGSSGPGHCNQAEREALLEFKADLRDPSSRLSSWAGDGDCCQWSGVTCDNITGHVTRLHLRCVQCLESSRFNGKINPSLLELKHLTHLDLSNNNFDGIQIPEFIGSMGSLNSLFLEVSGFRGAVPHQLGNLSSLQRLSLRDEGDHLLYANSLGWLSGLRSLQVLDLSKVDLSNASDWLNVVNVLPSLSELYLTNCRIRRDTPLPNVNLSSLSVLDLGINEFGSTSSFGGWISHVITLTSLDLRLNNFRGPVPEALRNLTSLRSLAMSSNHFNASLPDWLFGFRDMEELNFYDAKLVGKLPSELRNLTSLVKLELALNADLELEGGIPSSFKKLCRLSWLSLSFVKVHSSVSDVLDILGECPYRRLEMLMLDSCQLSGQLIDGIGKFRRLSHLSLTNNSISGPIPMSIGQMKSLRYLDLGRNQINGSIPTSFRELAKLEWADISMNSMEGVFSPEVHLANMKKLSRFIASGNRMVMKVRPDWVPPNSLYTLHLSSWCVGPDFPKWIRDFVHLESLDLSNCGIADAIPDWFLSGNQFQFGYLNLSRNLITGRLPSYLPAISSDSLFDFSWNRLEGQLPVTSSSLTGLDLSNNFFSGNLLKFLCFNPSQARDMQFLNLEANLLSGEIPNCWKNWPRLRVIRLASNNLTGGIPSSIGTLSSLVSLRIQNNSLTGEIPFSLKNCSRLVSLDLGDNEFQGKIPNWIGVGLPKLRIINLGGNRFLGNIPDELCHLQLLQILDLSRNLLSGNLPDCIANLTAMATSISDARGVINLFYGRSLLFVEYQILVTKGQVNGYSTILNYVRSLDLSWNNFSGQIPEQITRLTTLQYLNLSHNSFSGAIPADIAAMRSLESLDLSWNQMSGAIPPGMASLTFLNHLNLSWNNLSGSIPLSTQLQSLDSYSFIGNKGLCGLPLNKNCSSNDIIVPGLDEGKEDSIGLLWFSGNIVLGFLAGLWAVVIPVAVNRQWRKLYFDFLDNTGLKLWKWLRCRS